jgi:hypothetical protein
VDVLADNLTSIHGTVDGIPLVFQDELHLLREELVHLTAIMSLIDAFTKNGERYVRKFWLLLLRLREQNNRQDIFIGENFLNFQCAGLLRAAVSTPMLIANCDKSFVGLVHCC